MEEADLFLKWEPVFLRMVNLEISLIHPCTLKWKMAFAGTLPVPYNSLPKGYANNIQYNW
jgi:hypothetical protein